MRKKLDDKLFNTIDCLISLMILFVGWLQQKNFHLEKVVKLNQVVKYSYLTCWARIAESDERRLFQAVVDPFGFKVLLCEIKVPSSPVLP